MINLLHSLGWAFLATLWTMFLSGTFNLLLFKPETTEQHRELDRMDLSIGLCCGVIVFALTL